MPTSDIEDVALADISHNAPGEAGELPGVDAIDPLDGQNLSIGRNTDPWLVVRDQVTVLVPLDGRRWVAACPTSQLSGFILVDTQDGWLVEVTIREYGWHCEHKSQEVCTVHVFTQ